VEVKDVEPVDADSDELRPLVDPGLCIFGRGLDQGTIEAVMNGLRSGPLDAFPTGSYDVDDGADTVFRTADGEVSPEDTTVRDVPCWTLRGPDWLFGDCARLAAPTGGAVVLQRCSPIRPDPTARSTRSSSSPRLTPRRASRVEARRCCHIRDGQVVVWG